MKKPNETRFKHNFVIAAVLAVFLLATGCPNTNDPGGKEKPPVGGTDTETPKTPDQTTPETPSTEGEASGSEAGDATPGKETTKSSIKLTIKDLTKVVDGYSATGKEPYSKKGQKVSASGKTESEAVDAMRIKIKEFLDKEKTDAPDFAFALFNKEGKRATTADYVDGAVLSLGKQGQKTVAITVKKLGANAAGFIPAAAAAFNAGYVLTAKVPNVSTSADIARVLKMKAFAFVKQLNADQNDLEYALFPSDTVPTGTLSPFLLETDSAATEVFVNNGTLGLGQRERSGRLTVTVKKATFAGAASGNLVNGVLTTTTGLDSGKTYIAVTGAVTYGKVTIYANKTGDLPATVAANSVALKEAIAAKLGITATDIVDGANAANAKYLLLLVDPKEDTPIAAAIDPATGLRDGMEVYIVKQTS